MLTDPVHFHLVVSEACSLRINADTQTYLVKRKNEESSAATGLNDYGNKFGIDCTERAVPCDPWNPDIIVALVILHRLAKDMTEFALPYNSSHICGERAEIGLKITVTEITKHAGRTNTCIDHVNSLKNTKHPIHITGHSPYRSASVCVSVSPRSFTNTGNHFCRTMSETLQSNFSTSSCYRKHNLLDAISSDFKLLLTIFCCANRKTSEILRRFICGTLWEEKRTYPMQTKTDFVAGSAKIFTKTRICWHKGQLWKTSSFKSYMSHCSACNNRTLPKIMESWLVWDKRPGPWSSLTYSLDTDKSS